MSAGAGELVPMEVPYGEIERRYGRAFQALDRVLVYFMETCDQVNSKRRLQKRVVVIVRDSLYTCYENGGITRCVPLSNLDHAVVTGLDVVLKIPVEDHDAWLRMPSPDASRRFLETLSSIHQLVTGAPLPIRESSLRLEQQDVRLTQPAKGPIYLEPMTNAGPRLERGTSCNNSFLTLEDPTGDCLPSRRTPATQDVAPQAAPPPASAAKSRFLTRGAVPTPNYATPPPPPPLDDHPPQDNGLYTQGVAARGSVSHPVVDVPGGSGPGPMSITLTQEQISRANGGPIKINLRIGNQKGEPSAHPTPVASGSIPSPPTHTHSSPDVSPPAGSAPSRAASDPPRPPPPLPPSERSEPSNHLPPVGVPFYVTDPAVVPPAEAAHDAPPPPDSSHESTASACSDLGIEDTLRPSDSKLPTHDLVQPHVPHVESMVSCRAPPSSASQPLSAPVPGLVASETTLVTPWAPPSRTSRPQRPPLQESAVEMRQASSPQPRAAPASAESPIAAQARPVLYTTAAESRMSPQARPALHASAAESRMSPQARPALHASAAESRMTPQARPALHASATASQQPAAAPVPKAEQPKALHVDPTVPSMLNSANSQPGGAQPRAASHSSGTQLGARPTSVGPDVQVSPARAGSRSPAQGAMVDVEIPVAGGGRQWVRVPTADVGNVQGLVGKVTAAEAALQRKDDQLAAILSLLERNAAARKQHTSERAAALSEQITAAEADLGRVRGDLQAAKQQLIAEREAHLADLARRSHAHTNVHTTPRGHNAYHYSTYHSPGARLGPSPAREPHVSPGGASSRGQPRRTYTHSPVPQQENPESDWALMSRICQDIAQRIDGAKVVQTPRATEVKRHAVAQFSPLPKLV